MISKKQFCHKDSIASGSAAAYSLIKVPLKERGIFMLCIDRIPCKVIIRTDLYGSKNMFYL